MTNKTIALIDDEADARENIRLMLQAYCPDYAVVGEADTVASGVAMLRNCQPRILILDIAMSDGSGFDLLDFFPKPGFRVIFSTAFDHYAVKAFRYHAMDYLLKPVLPTELVATLDRAVVRTLETQHSQLAVMSHEFPPNTERLLVQTMECVEFVTLADILYLHADGNYTTLTLKNATSLVCSKSIGDFEAQLPPHQFFRTHHSYICNLSAILRLQKADGGALEMADGKIIPLARRRKDAFWVAIQKLDGVRN